jgi:xanthine dehydrogenase/oxidase
MLLIAAVQDGGKLQASGEAVYADDVPHVSGALHAAYVTSRLPHAALVGVDWSPALDVPGA